MSDTKAEFSERKKQSLKYKPYHYIEISGDMYIYTLTQFMTILKTRSKRSIHLVSKDVKCSDILSLLCSKSPRKYQNPSLGLETNFAPPSMTYLSG